MQFGIKHQRKPISVLWSSAKHWDGSSSLAILEHRVLQSEMNNRTEGNQIKFATGKLRITRIFAQKHAITHTCEQDSLMAEITVITPIIRAQCDLNNCINRNLEKRANSIQATSKVRYLPIHGKVRELGKQKSTLIVPVNLVLKRIRWSLSGTIWPLACVTLEVSSKSSGVVFSARTSLIIDRRFSHKSAGACGITVD